MAVANQFGLVAQEVETKIKAKFGLPPNQKPWRSGSFSDVYEINAGPHAGRLLRMTCVRGQRDMVYGMFQNTRVAAEQAGDLMPARFVLELHDLNIIDGKNCAIIESVIERLNAVPVADWLSKFSSPKTLMRELLVAGQMLQARGIVHRDISQNNVLYAYRPQTNSYKFIFIDSDDACVLPVGMTCSQTPQGTLGFMLPEFDGRYDEATGNKKVGLATNLANSKAYDGSMIYRYSSMALVHNMVHSLIMLGFVAVTKVVDAYELITLSEVVNLDMRWKHFFAQACMLETARRFTFETALQAVESLSEFNSDLGSESHASDANIRDFQLYGSLNSADLHLFSPPQSRANGLPPLDNSLEAFIREQLPSLDLLPLPGPVREMPAAKRRRPTRSSGYHTPSLHGRRTPPPKPLFASAK